MRFVSFVAANVFDTHVQMLLAHPKRASKLHEAESVFFLSNFFKSTAILNYSENAHMEQAAAVLLMSGEAEELSKKTL